MTSIWIAATLALILVNLTVRYFVPINGWAAYIALMVYSIACMTIGAALGLAWGMTQ
jgi:hypothetical protein